ncbi:diguanylate cyclase (GGDEF)-like protein [Paraburkholderia sp. GAS199]|uniref:GGDEF domain-containing protein n=1 Tax=Paraburkholderia sp. GAS199 TaxID=3035126 RepID=UPI003D23E224
MHVDLITLYLLAIGTLLASSGMTLWECRSHPKRSQALRILATAYATIAVGCAVAAFRRYLPGVTGPALSNLVILTGYLGILHGAASLNGRQYRVASALLVIVQAMIWAVGGVPWIGVIWGYVSAVPIALACGMTCRELLLGDGIKGLHSRYIAAWVSGVHALFYAGRAFVLPWLASLYGMPALSISSQITMYEGVLYSVVLPMTLLRMFREEAHGQLLQDSQTDYLTGLGNRRWFFEQGARLMREAGVFRPVSLLAFDLDQFKTINDRYGHEAGDEVLKSFASVARAVLGPDALLARIGGEEFAALLPGLDGTRGKEAGEAMVRHFAATVAHRTNGVAIQATVSAGLAHSQGATSTLADLLAAADRALYRAKSLGGNRLELASADHGERRRRSAV